MLFKVFKAWNVEEGRVVVGVCILLCDIFQIVLMYLILGLFACSVVFVGWRVLCWVWVLQSLILCVHYLMGSDLSVQSVVIFVSGWSVFRISYIPSLEYCKQNSRIRKKWTKKWRDQWRKGNLFDIFWRSQMSFSTRRE